MKEGGAIFNAIFINRLWLLPLGAAMLSWGSCMQLKLECPLLPLITLTFTGTFVIYNLHWTFGKFPKGFMHHFKSFKFLSLMMAGVVMLVWLMFRFRIYTFIALFPLGLAALLYILPPSGLPEWLYIRRYPFAKLFLISGVWTLVTLLIPVMESRVIPAKGLILFGLSVRFIFFTALALPFDVRDRHRDALDGLKTLPVLLGEKASYALSVGLTLLFIALHVAGGLAGIESWQNLIPSLIIASMLLLLLSCERCHHHTLYFIFWLDGLVLMFGVLLIVFNLII